MDPTSRLQPLLIIAGPTASGKTTLGLEVAETLGGEIVSADAFAVYRGMDIGTDKPDRAQRERVRHHLIDVADPAERYSAGTFARAASQAITDITSRGKTPVVVGGTHFYIDALLHGLFPAPPRDPRIRRRYMELWLDDPDALYLRLQEVDPEAAQRIGPRDRQRIFRALEVYEVTGFSISQHWKVQPTTRRYKPFLATPHRQPEALHARIEERVDRMFLSGLVEEVQRLIERGAPADAHAFKAIGYRQTLRFLDGEYDLSTAISETKRSSRQFANRQLAWLRGFRDSTVHKVQPAGTGIVELLIAMWHDHSKGSGLE